MEGEGGVRGGGWCRWWADSRKGKPCGKGNRNRPINLMVIAIIEVLGAVVHTRVLFVARTLADLRCDDDDAGVGGSARDVAREVISGHLKNGDDGGGGGDEWRW